MRPPLFFFTILPLLSTNLFISQQAICGAQPSIQVIPSEIDFGDQDPADGPTPSCEIVITNTGTAELLFVDEGISLTGFDRDAFDFLNGPDISPLAAGASREVSITFDPPSLGDFGTTLLLTTNDPLDATVEVLIFGTGKDDSIRIFKPPAGITAQWFGVTSTGLPDVNADGVPDLAVTSNLLSGGGSNKGGIDRPGIVFIFDGKTEEVIHVLLPPNDSINGRFGRSLCGIPDVNDDGCGDLLIGADFDEESGGVQDSGLAYIYDGSRGVILHTLSSPNAEEDGAFGRSVSAVPDVNEDGKWDVVVGAHKESSARFESSGNVYIFDGSTGDLLNQIASPNDIDFSIFGRTVAGLQDVNNDGKGDIAASGPSRKEEESRATVHVIDGSSGEFLRAMVSPNSVRGTSGGFGVALSSVPDIDGDLIDDLVVGAYLENPHGSPANAGWAYIFDPKSGDLLLEVGSLNPHLGGGFGLAVAGTTDLSGDGRGDIVVGARREFPNQFPGALSAGRSYVFVGSTGEWNELSSPNGHDFTLFGTSVSSVPDTNNDGLAEVLVGARNEYIPNSDDSFGRVYMFLSPFEFNPVPTRTVTHTPTTTPTPTSTSTPTSTITQTPTRTQPPDTLCLTDITITCNETDFSENPFLGSDPFSLRLLEGFETFTECESRMCTASEALAMCTIDCADQGDFTTCFGFLQNLQSTIEQCLSGNLNISFLSFDVVGADQLVVTVGSPSQCGWCLPCNEIGFICGGGGHGFILGPCVFNNLCDGVAGNEFDPPTGGISIGSFTTLFPALLFDRNMDGRVDARDLIIVIGEEMETPSAGVNTFVHFSLFWGREE